MTAGKHWSAPFTPVRPRAPRHHDAGVERPPGARAAQDGRATPAHPGDHDLGRGRRTGVDRHRGGGGPPAAGTTRARADVQRRAAEGERLTGYPTLKPHDSTS